jgi:hypothetical protein
LSVSCGRGIDLIIGEREEREKPGLRIFYRLLGRRIENFL